MNKEKINSIYEKFIGEGYKISSKECCGGYMDKNTCSWYHGNWMLFRYLGVVSNPYWHEEFYYDALKRFGDFEASNILVAGTADFSMPLLCSEVGMKNISVCDICNTPIEVCGRVADYLNLNWKVFRQDICKEIDTKYDIIINDAFISRFVEKKIPLEGIKNALHSGGYYITTLKKGKANRGGEVNKDIKEKFIEKVEKKYNEYIDVLPKVSIREIAGEYVDRMSSFPVSGEEEVKTLFDEAGLKILFLERGTVEGEYEFSEYFRIISQKE